MRSIFKSEASAEDVRKANAFKSGSGTELTLLRRSNRPEFDRLRAIAVDEGIIGAETAKDSYIRNSGFRQPQFRRYDPTEHSAREKFPKEQVENIWATQKVQLP